MIEEDVMEIFGTIGLREDNRIGRRVFAKTSWPCKVVCKKFAGSGVPGALGKIIVTRDDFRPLQFPA